MNVGEICERRVPTAPASTRVEAAARSMRAFGERYLVVTDLCDGKLQAVGIVTDGEFMSVVANRGDASRLTLRDIMRPNPGFVLETDDLFETLRWMRRNRLGHTVVYDSAGLPLGMVTLERLVETLADEAMGEPPLASEDPTHAWHRALH